MFITHAFQTCSSVVSPLRRGPTTSRRTVGDIRHPQSIRRRRLKVSPNQILGRLHLRITLCGRDEPASTHTAQRGGAHQARDSRAMMTQLGMYARCTVGAMRVPMDRLNLCGEPNAIPSLVRQAALSPGIQPALGDLEQPAHRCDRIVDLIHAHESEECLEFGAVSCANQAAAFGRISRSSFSCRFSRRKRA